MIVTNYAGEVVEWTGTEIEALAAGLNVNCTDCRYCRYCTDCTNCTDCTDCRYCRYCTNCTDCTDCRYCRYCTDCTDCTNCRYCRYCTDCTNCTDCRYCTDCPVQPKANLVTEVFVVTVRQDNTVKIGCQDWTVEKWLSFSEDQLSDMSCQALAFMRLWKPVILAIVNQPGREDT